MRDLLPINYKQQGKGAWVGHLVCCVQSVWGLRRFFSYMVCACVQIVQADASGVDSQMAQTCLPYMFSLPLYA